MSLRLSVVTPSFNQGQFIGRTIDSVLSQGVSDLEYFVFDAVSQDETPAILSEYRDRLQVHIEPDCGQADAVNKGLARATGDIIGWLNSDDVYYPGACTRVIAAFAAMPDVDMIYGEADHIDEHDQVLEKYYTEQFDYQKLKEVCFMCQPAVFFRRRVVEQYGLLDMNLRYCMDYEYWLRTTASRPPHFLRTPLAGSRLYAQTKTLGSAEAVHREILEMLATKFGAPPARWVYNLAHVIARERGLTRDTSDEDRAFVGAVVGAAEDAFKRYAGGIPAAEQPTLTAWRAHARLPRT